MRPTFATVVTTHAWEPRLVGFARQTGLAGLLGRCATFQQVADLRPDVVVVGTESPLATPPVVTAWKRLGLAVVAITQEDDPTATRRSVDCDAAFAAAVPPQIVLASLASLARPLPDAQSRWITVTGPRGAPGRSEVALALAWVASRHSPTVLVDLDLEAPCLGLRLGLPPFPRPGVVTCGPIQLAGFPPAHGPLSEPIRVGLLSTLTGTIVVDAGPGLTTGQGKPVLVVQADAGGVVRLVRMLERWRGPEPVLVVNRSGSPEVDGRIIQEATGLRPAAVVGELDETTEPVPLPGMVECLAGVTAMDPPSRLSA
jgi:hypothetical protein